MTSTTVDWLKEEQKNSICAFVIIECMGEIGIEKFGDFDASELNVTMQINGIDVDFGSAIEKIESQLEQMKESVLANQKEDLKELIKDSLHSFIDKLDI